jgi:hypothetical protein
MYTIEKRYPIGDIIGEEQRYNLDSLYNDLKLSEIAKDRRLLQKDFENDRAEDKNSKIMLIFRCGEEILLVKPHPNKSKFFAPVQSRVKNEEQKKDIIEKINDVCHRKLERRDNTEPFRMTDPNVLKMSFAGIGYAPYLKNNSPRLTNHKKGSTYYCFVVDVDKTFRLSRNVHTYDYEWKNTKDYLFKKSECTPRESKMDFIRSVIEAEERWADCTHWFEEEQPIDIS